METKTTASKVGVELSVEKKEISLSLIEEGDSLQKSGFFEGAIESYTKAIELNPENAHAYHKRGWARAHLGDIAGEFEDWSKAIELNPQFDAAYRDRAVARVAKRDYPGAIEDGNKAIKLNPELKKVMDALLNQIMKQVETNSQKVEEDWREKEGAEKQGEGSTGGYGRRDFIKVVTLTGVATVAALLPGCGKIGASEGKKGIKWGMIIDLERCVGCKACTVACKAENHTPPGVAYNVVLEKESGTYPYNKKVFISRPCMQCERSSCTMVCPVSATYHREDGIVVVDYDKCIGCRYCIAACPYGARSFDYGHNYSEDGSNPWEQQPSPEYGGQYSKREKGVSPEGNVRKCTFCLHRIYNGMAPACAATCIGNAIHFGNINDPDGTCMVHGENLQELLATRNYMRLKEETGNEPRVFYLT